MQKSGFPRWLVGADDLPDAVRRYCEDGCIVIFLRDDRPPAGLPPSLHGENASAPRIGRDSFLLRRQVARQLAAAITGAPPDSFAIRAGAGGAPVISGPGRPLWLSFSGRDGASLVALAERPIGVDIEMDVEKADIPVNMLRDDEREMLDALPPSGRVRHFASLWTMKEAIAKAMHLGFVLDPEAIRVTDGGLPSVQVNGQWRTFPARTDIARIKIRPGTCATLARALLSSPGASAMTVANSPLREPVRWMP